MPHHLARGPVQCGRLVCPGRHAGRRRRGPLGAAGMPRAGRCRMGLDGRAGGAAGGAVCGVGGAAGVKWGQPVGNRLWESNRERLFKAADCCRSTKSHHTIAFKRRAEPHCGQCDLAYSHQIQIPFNGLLPPLKRVARHRDRRHSQRPSQVKKVRG